MISLPFCLLPLLQDHLQGKQYLGWKKIRDHFTMMKEKRAAGYGRDRYPERERDRDRERPPRSSSREYGYERRGGSRDPYERERGGYYERERGHERGYDRGYDRRGYEGRGDPRRDRDRSPRRGSSGREQGERDRDYRRSAAGAEVGPPQDLYGRPGRSGAADVSVWRGHGGREGRFAMHCAFVGYAIEQLQ